MAAAAAQCYFRFTIQWLLSEDQNLYANQICRHIRHLRLRYNYFRFGKTKMHHIEIILPVSMSTQSTHQHFILKRSTKFHLNNTTHVGVRPYDVIGFQNGGRCGEILIPPGQCHAKPTMRSTNSNKKLSCRRETARRFMSLNILLSRSRSLKVIRNDTVE